MQEFLAQRKVVTTHRKKWFFFNMFNIAYQLLTHHKPSTPLSQVKVFAILNP